MAVLGWTEFAIALAPNEPDGYRALGCILLSRTEYDQAKDAVKRAIEINPSDASNLAVWGSVQSFSGEVGGATESLELALKLDPMLEPKFVSPIISRIATRPRS
ncbi:tetratricopeptide repeat protein [Bradyrhizobium sp. AUGA SZCCT0283]|uniref:tetratricopeptide repeat protein n=1 Tax=Bradyrhizobium sp. AUGA SZCCT0283 TaxID=2807671 RepID=UPI001BA6122A|nr:tetratricopeptide repeat protein [Bradyrhizobium sp. AUGA SZCCT0283]MBR1279322.1 tetratricopeptide repeat protein [Bradyrhizobium sp. AUGA SZCCT0283]